MPIILELAPIQEVRLDAVSDLLMDVANRLPEDLLNTAGMAVIIMDDLGGVEILQCGLSYLQLIGMLEEAKFMTMYDTVPQGGEEDE